MPIDFFHDMPAEQGEPLTTVAEGIAVKRPGELNRAMIRKYVDDICVVHEPQIEQAIFDLLEIEKTVAEGAGAAGLAL